MSLVFLRFLQENSHNSTMKSSKLIVEFPVESAMSFGLGSLVGLAVRLARPAYIGLQRLHAAPVSVPRIVA